MTASVLKHFEPLKSLDRTQQRQANAIWLTFTSLPATENVHREPVWPSGKALGW